MYSGTNRGAIVTLTANPSLDRTVELSGVLARGAVQRAAGFHEEPGGKGVNVCRALKASGTACVAVLPGDNGDPVVAGLRSAGIDHRNLPIGAALRANLTFTEPDGTTTKVNLPGPELGPEVQENLLALTLEACTGPEDTQAARWLVLAGSLPPGVPSDYYAVVADAVRRRFPQNTPALAIDSSGPPLLGALLHGAAPSLLKPNGEELAEVTGIATGDELESDPSLAAGAALTLIERGVGAVLATLGARGALLVTPDGAWLATRPPVTPRSTVGAGDSSLAGYLLAESAGKPPQDCLRQAVAHGAAAASLPGTRVPSLEETHPEEVTVHPVDPRPVPGSSARRGPAPTSSKEQS
ncbi:1-phosphofructokinase [Arthrobacter sp. Sa2BUA2]|uniref:1-phosphofructokinase n=1 Tax=Arthrobacter pullicola TaxID=2762224 RepID=A0ABR8YDJ7_9MICC|nr:1-phosphofructokinase [Arthrobacter pullicola]MBD8042280.1 1-phosphofructokinase [Arthrobacter pullicola]